MLGDSRSLPVDQDIAHAPNDERQAVATALAISFRSGGGFSPAVTRLMASSVWFSGITCYLCLPCWRFLLREWGRLSALGLRHRVGEGAERFIGDFVVRAGLAGPC